jgi:hypothetical protein
VTAAAAAEPAEGERACAPRGVAATAGAVGRTGAPGVAPAGGVGEAGRGTCADAGREAKVIASNKAAVRMTPLG